MLPAVGRIWGINGARPLPGCAGGMQALHFEPENKRRRANLPRLGLGPGYACRLCAFILGWDASCGTRGGGQVPGEPVAEGLQLLLASGLADGSSPLADLAPFLSKTTRHILR